MYDSDVELFDITEARLSLQSKRSDLLAECEANTKLQRRFDMINMQLRKGLTANTASSEGSNSGPSASVASGSSDDDMDVDAMLTGRGDLLDDDDLSLPSDEEFDRVAVGLLDSYDGDNSNESANSGAGNNASKRNNKSQQAKKSNSNKSTRGGRRKSSEVR